MQTLTDLAKYCQDHPYEEKLLLGATILQARMLRESLARGGTPWLALRIGNVRHLAENIVAPAVSSSDEFSAAMHAESAFREACANSERTAPLRMHPALQAAFVDAITDLSLADIDPATLIREDSNDPKRILDLASTAALLRGRNGDSIADYPELLRKALGILKENPTTTRPSILVPYEVYQNLSLLELAVVRAASASAPVVLGSDLDQSNTISFRFRSTLAPEHEFRAALRDLVTQAIPYEDVEIVYTDSSRLPELYELAVETDLPATFAEGIPVQYSKTARTLQRFLEWLRDGDPYPLIRLMYEGIPDFTAFICDGVQANRLPTAALLREAHLDHNQYTTLQRVDRLIAIKERSGTQSEELSVLRAGRELIAAIHGLLPAQAESGDVPFHDIVRGATRLVRDLCRPASPGEPEAVACIVRMLELHARGSNFTLPLPDAAARLLDALLKLRMPAVIKQIGGVAEQSSMPIPGHVYVTDLPHAGFSGRRHIFLLGMDDESMTGLHPENPILPDEDRRRIMRRMGRRLPLSGDHARQKAAMLRAFLARCVGNVTASYARYDGTRLRKTSPSRELLAIFRRSTGDAMAGFRDLEAACSTIESDIPGNGYASLQEWWMSVRHSISGADLAAALQRHYPMQASGHQAEVARASTSFTAYDGLTSPSDAPPLLSVAQLEELARCPYRYFLKNVLQLSAPQKMKSTADRWLSPMEYGKMMRGILRSFMETVVSESLPREQWTGRMDDLIATALTEQANNIPPPSHAARAQSEQALRAACTRFVTDEIMSTGSTPLSFEVAFPTDRQLPNPLKALPEPLRLETPQGSIFLSGAIDRIELDSDNGLRIIQFVTGNDEGKTSERAPSTDMLRPGICTEAVRRMTEAGTISNIRFFYRFLSDDKRQRVVEVESFGPALRVYAGRLLDLLKRGSFPHTSDPAACMSCEFSRTCGDVFVTASHMNLKLDNPANGDLAAWRELRDAC